MRVPFFKNINKTKEYPQLSNNYMTIYRKTKQTQFLNENGFLSGYVCLTNFFKECLNFFFDFVLLV